MEYIDKELVCSQCNKNFIFEKGEQKFFAMKEYKEPKRCPTCRLNRKSGIKPIIEKTTDKDLIGN